MHLTQEQMQEIEQAMADSVCVGECQECGYSQDVEPDGNYPCPECGDGKLQSPLVKYGII